MAGHGLASPELRYDVRIFLGPIEVAGFYSAIRRGLEDEGEEVIFADLLGDARRYDSGERSLMVRVVRAVERVARAGEP